MNKTSVKKLRWLKALHIFLASVWIGTGISLLALGLFKGTVANGDELYGVYFSKKLLDDFLIIPSAFGTLITGALIAWLTNWGFLKYKWIIFKWVVGIGQVLLGMFFLGPWGNGATAIVQAERAQALYNEQFLYFTKMSMSLSFVQLLLIIIVVYVSVFKPWGKRNIDNDQGSAHSTNMPG